MRSAIRSTSRRSPAARTPATAARSRTSRATSSRSRCSDRRAGRPGPPRLIAVVDSAAEQRQGSSVADVGYIAIIVAGFGAYWWRHLRPRPHDQTSELFEPDAEGALHVAVHEAASRQHRLSSLHVLYGLLQDDSVIAAITTAGGDADALED